MTSNIVMNQFNLGILAESIMLNRMMTKSWFSNSMLRCCKTNSAKCTCLVCVMKLVSISSWRDFKVNALTMNSYHRKNCKICKEFKTRLSNRKAIN